MSVQAPEGESQPMTEVDLFISTQRIKVLSADTQVRQKTHPTVLLMFCECCLLWFLSCFQEAMMDHALQMISYIADIGNIVVLMARRKPASRKSADSQASSAAPPKKCWMICHVFSSEDVSAFYVMSTLIKSKNVPSSLLLGLYYVFIYKYVFWDIIWSTFSLICVFFRLRSSHRPSVRLLVLHISSFCMLTE